jgi:hypothetical protein
MTPISFHGSLDGFRPIRSIVQFTRLNFAGPDGLVLGQVIEDQLAPVAALRRSDQWLVAREESLIFLLTGDMIKPWTPSYHRMFLPTCNAPSS